MTNRVRDADHEGENVMQKAMMQMHDAGWVGRDLPTIATTALTASGLPVRRGQNASREAARVAVAKP